MLEFPFQQEKRAFVANREARNQGWWNTGFPALTLFPISGCGNLFWIQLQVENPSLAEQPERPSCQSPKCAAETLALWGWSWSCLPKICAAVKVAVMPLWVVSASSFGSDLETCQLQQLSCSLSIALITGPGGWREGLASSGSVIPRVWQVPALVPCSPSACHPLGVGGGGVQVCWVWVAACSPLAQLPAPGNQVAVSDRQPVCTDRLHVGTCLAALRRDARRQLKILEGRGAKDASYVPKVWFHFLEATNFLGEIKVIRNVQSKREKAFWNRQPLRVASVFWKLLPLSLSSSCPFPFKRLYYYFLICLCHWTFIDRNQIAVFLGRAPAAERCGSRAMRHAAQQLSLQCPHITSLP